MMEKDQTKWETDEMSTKQKSNHHSNTIPEIKIRRATQDQADNAKSTARKVRQNPPMTERVTVRRIENDVVKRKNNEILCYKKWQKLNYAFKQLSKQ